MIDDQKRAKQQADSMLLVIVSACGMLIITLVALILETINQIIKIL